MLEIEKMYEKDKHDCDICRCSTCKEKAETEQSDGCITCYYCMGTIRICKAYECK